MNEIRTFVNEKFGSVRVLEENGKPLFCGTDVAKALGYAKPNNAINDHCRYTLKRGIPHPQSPDKVIEVSFIPEGDVYRLVSHSKLPSAERFESWVFDEILPIIRKTGGEDKIDESANDVTIMESPRFGKVRKVMMGGEWYYVATDVAKALEYVNPRDAVLKHCRCVAKRDVPHPQSPSKTLEVSVIPKGDVLRLISESHLPAAQEFNHWLFDGVAVSVVDTGMYLTDGAMEKLFADPDNFVALAVKWRDERKARLAAERTISLQQEKIAIDAPKVAFAEKVSASEAAITVAQMATLLKQNGVKTGQNRFYAWLRDNGYCVATGARRNAPTQKSLELGILEAQEAVFKVGDKDGLKLSSRVTPKGQHYFLKKFTEQKQAS